MVKSHLAKWRVTKNTPLQPCHIKAILRKSRSFVASGKTPPVFKVRGRQRTYEDAVVAAGKWGIDAAGEMGTERESTPENLEIMKEMESGAGEN